MCGTVTVPLHRTDPAKGTIDLFFEYFAQPPDALAGSAAAGTASNRRLIRRVQAASDPECKGSPR